jgi:hypothetical protein
MGHFQRDPVASTLPASAHLFIRFPARHKKPKRVSGWQAVVVSERDPLEKALAKICRLLPGERKSSSAVPQLPRVQ